jgi:hypothetical protein
LKRCFRRHAEFREFFPLIPSVRVLPNITLKHFQQACADGSYGNRSVFHDILIALHNERVFFKGHSVEKAENDLGA